MTEEGDYVLDTQNRRIRLNTLIDSSITDDGTIYQNGQAVAKIQVTDFEDYDYLEKYGETYYQPIQGMSEEIPFFFNIETVLTFGARILSAAASALTSPGSPSFCPS